MVTDLAMQPHLDDMIDHLLCVKSNLDAGSNGAVTVGSELRWNKAKAVWPTSSRDFVVVSSSATFAEARKRGWLQGPDLGDEAASYIVVSQAADKLVPLIEESSLTATEADAFQKLKRSDAKGSCVRGRLNVSGYILKKVAEGTELSLIAHAEVFAPLPASVVNKFAVAAPAKMVQNIREKSAECAERGIDAVLGR